MMITQLEKEILPLRLPLTPPHTVDLEQQERRREKNRKAEKQRLHEVESLLSIPVPNRILDTKHRFASLELQARHETRRGKGRH